MGYALLWIEWLAAAVSLTALLMAHAMRRKGKWWRRLLAGLGIVLPGVPMVYLLVLTAHVAFNLHLNGDHFWWAVTLTVAYVVGAVVIRLRAGKRDAGVNRGQSWVPRRLAIGWLLMCLILAMTLWNLNLRAELEAQGLRTTAAEILYSVARAPVPEAQDAAPLYDQAAKLYEAARVPEDEAADYRGMEVTSSKLAAYLKRQEKALAAVRRAADMAGCNSLEKTDEPGQEEIPRLGPFRLAVNLLSDAARVEAAAGNLDLAFDDCRRIYVVGEHCGARPIMITSLVSIAIDDIAGKSVATVLPFATTRGQVERLVIPEVQAARRMNARALRGEEAFGLAHFSMYVRNEQEGGPVLGPVSWQLWLKADAGVYRQNLEAAQKSFEHPYYESGTRHPTLEETMKAESRRGVLSIGITSEIVHWAQQATRSEVMRLAARVAQAATLYRLERGAYPETAEALVPGFLPAVPVDPFDGKALRFKKLGDGSVVIYSVGANLKDEGGDLARENRDFKDVGVALALPPKAGNLGGGVGSAPAP